MARRTTSAMTRSRENTGWLERGIDRMIQPISPETVLRRELVRYRQQCLSDIKMTGYSHGGASRQQNYARGWTYSGGSTDDDIGVNWSVLAQRGRDLRMNDAVAAGAFTTLKREVVGPGLTLKADVDAEVLGISEEEAEQKNREIEREFAIFAESTNCDYARQLDFYEMQALAFLTPKVTGDAFALLPVKKRRHSIYDLTIQLIEGDRCLNKGMYPWSSYQLQVINLPNGGFVSQGVEVGPDGDTVAYWISRWHPLSQQPVRHINEWDRVEAIGPLTGRRNILHLFEPERPEQRRGVSILASVIKDLKQLCRYKEAKLMNAVIQSFFTVFVTSDTPETPLGEESIPPPLNVLPTPQEMLTPGVQPNAVEEADDLANLQLGSGTIAGLKPGHKIEIAEPKGQDADVEAFMNAFLKHIGAALGIPFEILTLHFSSSYSASRGALLTFWKSVIAYRAWLVKRFCKPVYEEWFAEAVAKGRIAAPGFWTDERIRRAYTRSEWHGSSMGQINPLDEINAATARVALGVSTRDRESTEINGSNINGNIRQLTKEKDLIQDGGLDYMLATVPGAKVVEPVADKRDGNEVQK